MTPLTSGPFDGIVGTSTSIREVIARLEKIAPYDVPVLVQGESGTGKELAARGIHFASPRRDKEFVIINCSAFQDTLLESELFGHVRGAFTGALHEKKGLFEVADQGTFFLDEIADMSPALQVKLLRVLQEGTFLKIGGTEPIRVNVRIIAASNKNLKELVDKKQFRDDLFYRVNVMTVLLPPLRDRREDISMLCGYILDRLAHKNHDLKKALSEDALKILMECDWPGNVRQLENELEKVCILSSGPVISPEVLSPEVRFRGGERRSADRTEQNYVLVDGRSLADLKREVWEGVERRAIVEGLRRTNGNKSACARLLQVSRGDLMRKIARYKISGSDRRE